MIAQVNPAQKPVSASSLAKQGKKKRKEKKRAYVIVGERKVGGEWQLDEIDGNTVYTHGISARNALRELPKDSDFYRHRIITCGRG